MKNTELSFLPDDDISRKVYIKSVDLTLKDEMTAREMGKKSLPMAASPQDLCSFYVTPARHQAYSSFWLYATILVSAGNAVVWFYF